MLPIKEEYDGLLSTGMMFEFCPQLSGNYKDDFTQWKDIYDKLKITRNENRREV